MQRHTVSSRLEHSRQVTRPMSAVRDRVMRAPILQLSPCTRACLPHSPPPQSSYLDHRFRRTGIHSGHLHGQYMSVGDRGHTLCLSNYCRHASHGNLQPQTHSSSVLGVDQNNDPTGPIGPSAFCVSSMGNSEVHNGGPPNSPRTASDRSPFPLSASRYAGPSLCPRPTLHGATTKVPETEESRPPGDIPGLNTVQPGPTAPLN